jgi:isoleucyl-tRNA synthetase
VIAQTTEGFESYELDVATRPLNEFVDDLSTWYLRRSRDRFKNDTEDKVAALATLRQVLYTVAHVMSPVMPFYAEYLYSQMKEEHDLESVHLSQWPDALPVDLPLVANMREVRIISSQALQLREKVGIKIRQPLAKLAVRRLMIEPELQALIAEEINVKEIVEDSSLEQDLWLDTALTPELKAEGVMRDLVRKIQEWRKEQGMQISDRPSYTLAATAEEKAVAEKYSDEIIAQTGLSDLAVELGGNA